MSCIITIVRSANNKMSIPVSYRQDDREMSIQLLSYEDNVNTIAEVAVNGKVVVSYSKDKMGRYYCTRKGEKKEISSDLVRKYIRRLNMVG